MKYFDFYELPITFALDEQKLRKQFLLKSKQYHPDFYTLESEEKQEEILALSSLNNEAYKVLKNEDKRLKYILEQRGMIGESAKNKMTQDFLMEMMDINEKVMDLQFDFDEKSHQEIIILVQQKEFSLKEALQPLLLNYDNNNSSEKILNQIKDLYLEKCYLLRLKENIAKLS